MVKKFGLKFIVTILTSFIYIKRFFVYIGKKLLLPTRFIYRLFAGTIFLPVYKTYVLIYKNLQKLFSPIKQWAFAPLGGKYVIYVVVVLISFTVLFDNINAQETRIDETSLELQNNIIYKLTADEDLELIEEKRTETPVSQRFTYLDDTFTKPYLSRQDTIDALLENNVDPIELVQGDTLIKPSISATQTNLKLRDQVITYTVLSGDTLGGIAQKFGLNIQSILWANNLTLRSYIKPGQSLTIPPVNGMIYKIKRNDTLSKIASTYKADVDKIIEFNNLIDATDIQVGQSVMLPDAEKPAPVVRRTAPPKRTAPIPTVYEKTSPTYSNSTSTSKLLWPTDMRVITQYYSWRHTGLDIDGTYQTRNYASESGTVIKAQGGWNGGYGLYVIIDHGGGLQTLYAHNSKLFVKVGDRVQRGQVIGMVGSTGRSTGTHIHYEVRLNGKRVNPLHYIR